MPRRGTYFIPTGHYWSEHGPIFLGPFVAKEDADTYWVKLVEDARADWRGVPGDMRDNWYVSTPHTASACLVRWGRRWRERVVPPPPEATVAAVEQSLDK